MNVPNTHPSDEQASQNLIRAEQQAYTRRMNELNQERQKKLNEDMQSALRNQET